MASARIRRGRRGRAALLWAAGLFAASQLTLSLLLDYVCPSVRSTWFANVDQVWRSRPVGPDVLCLGSSRMASDLLPAALKLAFRDELGEVAPRRILNLAVPCGDAISSEFVLRRLLRQGARPELVV